jgi:hypothetical protein
MWNVTELQDTHPPKVIVHAGSTMPVVGIQQPPCHCELADVSIDQQLSRLDGAKRCKHAVGAMSNLPINMPHVTHHHPCVSTAFCSTGGHGGLRAV